MIKILLTFASIIAVTLLLVLYMSNNGISGQQGFGQQIDVTTNNTNSSVANENLSNVPESTPGQSIFYRGIEASEEPVYLNFSHPGVKEQTINILPHRDDGASYKGILTFTATEPVGVGIGHRLPVDSTILSQIQSDELRDLTTVIYNDKGNELGDIGLMSASSIINPDYGVSPPYFSDSIPFAGSNLYLTTQQSEPFVAVYEVSADVIQPQNIVDLDGLNSGINTTVNTSS